MRKPIQEIQTEAMETKQGLEKTAKAILDSLQADQYTSKKSCSPLTQETQPNQWRQTQNNWSPDQSQPSGCYNLQTSNTNFGTQEDIHLQQPSEDKDNVTHTRTTNRFQESINQRDKEYQAQQIYERSKCIHDKIHNFKKANLKYSVSHDNPSQEEIETLYCNIAAEMRACHMPIVPF
jgi:hypothetical protein